MLTFTALEIVDRVVEIGADLSKVLVRPTVISFRLDLIASPEDMFKSFEWRIVLVFHSLRALSEDHVALIRLQIKLLWL